MTFNTHCDLRLGDNLAHLHWLRKMAQVYPEHRFVNAAHLCYLNQLQEVVWDLPNLRLIPTEYKPGDSIDVWKNAGGYWETHLLKNDYGRFYICFFRMIAEKMGLESPLNEPSDLLFDYPAILKPKAVSEPFDCLVINSAPQSGQWKKYNEANMNAMIAVLARQMKVITTAKTPFDLACTNDPRLTYTVTSIGSLSLHCKYIVMVSTGPSWPTFNIWNKETIKRRVILIDSENVNIAPNTVSCDNCMDAIKMLQLEGILR